ncbi:MAG: hypothetical protein JJ896_17535 [Rhodothermales bacterium]|nr:hypothetical protein [Rhodothermales bacterium]MBO6781464.1 hypothetical protein [Rhodothermales bacterium]
MGISVTDVAEGIDLARKLHSQAVRYAAIAVENKLDPAEMGGDVKFHYAGDMFLEGSYCEIGPNEGELTFDAEEGIVFGTFVDSIFYSQCQGAIYFKAPKIDQGLMAYVNQTSGGDWYAGTLCGDCNSCDDLWAKGQGTVFQWLEDRRFDGGTDYEWRGLHVTAKFSKRDLLIQLHHVGEATVSGLSNP